MYDRKIFEQAMEDAINRHFSPEQEARRIARQYLFKPRQADKSNAMRQVYAVKDEYKVIEAIRSVENHEDPLDEKLGNGKAYINQMGQVMVMNPKTGVYDPQPPRPQAPHRIHWDRDEDLLVCTCKRACGQRFAWLEQYGDTVVHDYLLSSDTDVSVNVCVPIALGLTDARVKIVRSDEADILEVTDLFHRDITTVLGFGDSIKTLSLMTDDWLMSHPGHAEFKQMIEKGVLYTHPCLGKNHTKRAFLLSDIGTVTEGSVTEQEVDAVAAAMLYYQLAEGICFLCANANNTRPSQYMVDNDYPF